jgi:hypothetical protein
MWIIPSNWKYNGGTNYSGTYPGEFSTTDVVNIGNGTSYSTNQPNLTSLVTTTIAQLNMGSTVAPDLTLSSALNVTGAINVNGTATVDGGATLTGGSMTLSTSNTLTLNTPVNISGQLTINNGITPIISVGTGYTMTVAGGQNVGNYSNTLLTFAGGGTSVFNGTSNFNYSAGLNINYPATVTMNANASFNSPPPFTNGGTLNLNNAAFPFINNITNSGNINITGSSASISNTYNSPTITNTGTISINAGNISTTGNINSSTVFTETNGANVTLNATNTFTNSGTYSLSSSTLTLNNNNTALNNSASGTISAVSSTLSMAGAGAAITNAGAIKATGTTFSFGNGNHITNNNGATFIAQPSSAFSMTTSGSYITNSGSWADHGSTYTMTGQGANIQNTGSGANMVFRGTTINMSGGSGGNAQILNNTATLTADSATNITCGLYQARVTNSGTFLAGTSGSSCIISLTAQGAYVSNSNIFKLGSTSIIYPTAASTQINNTAGTFTIQSDANGSGAIGPLNTTGGQLASCNGTFSVERFYQGSTTYDNVKKRWLARNYRIISSPVNNNQKSNGSYLFGLNYIVGATAGQTTAANSTTNAFITGCTGGSTPAGNPSAYLYKESITPSNLTFISGNFLGITNITNSTTLGTVTASDGGTYSLPVGTGVFFFDRGAATSWSTRTVYPYIAPENVTLTSSGSINQYSVVVKDYYNITASTLAYTGTGTGTNYAVRGFNMIGNPYPCTIDWETVNSGGITVTNINPTVYVFNPVTNQYDTYSSSTHIGSTTTFLGKIASGQGFFVQATNSSSPALTINETAKAPTSFPTGTSLYMGTPVAQGPAQLLRLKLVIDTLNYDDIVVAFNSSASAKYNPAEDGFYLPGINAMESLSSLSDDQVPLSINSLPLPKQTAQVIKLKVTGKVTGLYTLNRTALQAIPEIYEVWLMDSYKKDSLDLRANTTYAFNIDQADTNSFGSNRFQIVIRQNKALAMHLLNFAAVKDINAAQITWKTENEENYTNFAVERSTDNGATFSAIGGFTSSALGTYTLTDKNPLNGANEYRLKIEDMNGTISYSDVITLSFGNGTNLASNYINIYPNPASGTINLAISPITAAAAGSNLSALQTAAITPGLPASAGTTETASYQIRIVNITGEVVKTATSTTTNWQANVGGLLPGTYIIQVTNNNDNSLVGKGTFIKM